jgi:hypothetical protein
MALRINFKTKKNSSTYPPPPVNKIKYEFGPFEPDPFTLSAETTDGKTVTRQADVQGDLEEAWRFVTGTAAKYPSCNKYFKSLSRHKSLQEVLDEGDITIHRLVPKNKDRFGKGAMYTQADLPAADTAGRHIGLNETSFLDPEGLRCTLIHELAHVAGASTNAAPEDPRSLEAELALKYCKCGEPNPENRGMAPQKNKTTRLA